MSGFFLAETVCGRAWRGGSPASGRFAARVSVDKASLGRWERRKIEPTLGNSCAWAEELGFDVVLRPTWIGE